MSAPVDLKLVGGLTLDELLHSLEEEDANSFPDSSLFSVAILPPTNATGEVTDEDSGEEDNVNVNNLPGSQLLAEAEVLVHEDDHYSDEDDPEDNMLLSDIRNQLLLNKKIKKRATYRWKKVDITKPDVTFPAVLSVENNNSPFELFSMFWNDDIITLFTEYSNTYAASKNKLANITETEIRSFFGILLLSGYVPLPRRRMFWENSDDTHNNLVSGAISRDRFEYVLSNLHCCDNNNLDRTDRFAKIRPLCNKLNKLFQEFAPICENHSVDEGMVPYYGRHGCKQFIKGKPIRYGYKFWVGSTSTGYVLWLEPYQGAKSEIKPEYIEYGLGPSVVLQYSDILKNLGPFPYHIFCDNFFTTIPMLDLLSKRNIRDNRIMNCPLLTKNDMKRKCRGFIDFQSNEENIVVTKWNDNNIVTLASNAVPVYPTRQVLRFSRKEKKKISVSQPLNISTYNSYMGGVDRSDQNISLYRTAIRGKKWYFPIIAHFLDVSVQNAWQKHRSQGGTLDHLTFRRRIALCILECNQRSIVKRRSKPSALENLDSRYDRLDHLVISQENQTRCRVCHKKVSTACEKCKVALHINCFKTYHVK